MKPRTKIFGALPYGSTYKVSYGSPVGLLPVDEPEVSRLGPGTYLFMDDETFEVWKFSIREQGTKSVISSSHLDEVYPQCLLKKVLESNFI